MSFDQALEDNRIPLAVGDIRLRYETSLLVGDQRKPISSWIPDSLWLLAVCIGVLTLIWVVLPQTQELLSLAAIGAALTAGLGIAATVLDQRRRRRRTFVLNFGTESLRIDRPRGRFVRPTTTIVPFDSVRDVQVVPQRGGRFGIAVTYQAPRSGHSTTEWLIESIAPPEIGEARRLWRVLFNAFGLRPPHAVPSRDLE